VGLDLVERSPTRFAAQGDAWATLLIANAMAVKQTFYHPFARFLAAVPPDASESSPEFLAFAAHLSSGPPPDGQDYLRDAFAHYQRQRRETDRAALSSESRFSLAYPGLVAGLPYSDPLGRSSDRR